MVMRPYISSHWEHLSSKIVTRPVASFAILSAIWVLGLYWHALRAPFIYDDLEQIVRNPDLSSFHATFHRFFLTPSPFTSRFRGAGGSNYRPLFWLSLSLDRHIWGIRGASGFHATSILLHWMNGILLFLALRRVGIATALAAVAAFVWLGMPINSEAVAWISGRAYVLCGMFLALGLLFSCSFLSNPRPITLSAVLLVSFAALLSHEAGALFLPLTLLLVYRSGRIFTQASLVLLSTVGISDSLFLGVRQLVGVRSAGGSPAVWPVGLAFWKYAVWMMVPIHMSMQRVLSTPPNILSVQAIIALCALAILCISILFMMQRLPIIAIGLAWATIAILPFCGIIFIYQGMAERYEYFASAGVALAISSMVFHLKARSKQIVAALVILWAAWSAWRLKERVLDWCDPVALYQSSIEATPDPMLFYDLGWAWRERGDLNQALANYQEAVRRRPSYQEAYASIAEVQSMLGRPKVAIPSYEQALALDPSDSATRVDFAVTLEQIGKSQEAAEELERALNAAPANITALNDLGSLLLLDGRRDEAIRYFQRAIEVKPMDTTAYYNLAVLYQRQGQVDEALMYYQKVLALNPNDPDVLTNLAKLYGH